MSARINFDALPDRRTSNSYKWDYLPAGYPDGLLPMWVADMDYPVAQPILEAVSRRMDHPVFGYTYAPDSYKDSFLEWQRARNHWEIDRSWVCEAPGVVPAVRAAVQAFTRRGEGVIIQSPVYHVFYQVIRENGRHVVENPLRQIDGAHRMDLDDLDEKLGAGARLVLLCSPHNPVSRVWTRDELMEFAEVCQSHGAIVVADEIHSDIILTDRPFVPFASLGTNIAETTLGCYSPSKTWNIASLSLAQIVAAGETLRKAYRKVVRRNGLGSHDALSFAAVEAAYRHGAEWADAMLSYLRGVVDLLVQELSDCIPEVALCPVEGTYLAWIDCRRLLDRLGASEKQFHGQLLNTGKLWLSRGSDYGTGGDGFFRMNFATSATVVRDAVARMVRTVESLS